MESSLYFTDIFNTDHLRIYKLTEIDSQKEN